MSSEATEHGLSPQRRRVFVLNHAREPLGELIAALSHAGFDAAEAGSVTESLRLLAQARPSVVVLSPLALAADGVEMEMLKTLQREDDPVPVILLLEDLAAFEDARQLSLPCLDFLVQPCSGAECVHRVQLALTARARLQQLHTRTRYLEGQVSVDFKTGLISELYFKRILPLEWKRAQRHQNPLSLLLIDVDDFKSVNDTTEYAFGDEVLRRVGEALKGAVRETDFAARLGGDEFCVLLPQTSPAEAVQTALRIRQHIAELTVRAERYSRQVTVSIGIDSSDGRSPGSVDTLRRRANKALQEAKRRGKNQVWLFADPDIAEDRPDRGPNPERSGAAS